MTDRRWTRFCVAAATIGVLFFVALAAGRPAEAQPVAPRGLRGAMIKRIGRLT